MKNILRIKLKKFMKIFLLVLNKKTFICIDNNIGNDKNNECELKNY